MISNGIVIDFKIPKSNVTYILNNLHILQKLTESIAKNEIKLSEKHLSKMSSMS